MKQIGYSLIDENDAEVESYGGLPAVLYLPNGDQVHAPAVGQYGSYRLIERWLIDTPPSPLHAAVGETTTFDGGKIFITVVYESKPSIKPPAPTSETSVLHDHENRIRAIEGQPPLTLTDFSTKMRGKNNGST